MQIEITNLKKAVQHHQSDLVKFAQKLIQTPSLSHLGILRLQ